MSQAVLFVSSASPNSKRCVRLLQQMGVQLPLIRLDSHEAKQRALQGPYFQISSVPSLVVTTPEGTVQVYAGVEKITQWVGAMTRTPPPPPSAPSTPNPPESRKKKKRSRPRKGSKKVVIEEEEDPPEDTIDIEFLESGETSSSSHVLSKNSNKMISLMERAKQMEEEAERSRGYREKDLPRY